MNSIFLGMCYKCGKTILGEGCTALNQLYHIECFTCNVCGKLNQIVYLMKRSFRRSNSDRMVDVQYMNFYWNSNVFI